MCGLPVDVSGASEVHGGFEGASLQAPGDEASLRFSARSLLCSSVHLKGSRWCLIYKPVKVDSLEWIPVISVDFI
ncbi:hypothetical protein M758_5G139300 [Ceratodon purpureus]|uniref:Uncharacterized protein n=1 Tax=Ceratodon purpureus TaxID=3225 RepID=A0A8T0I2W9_CERPU|nr:hypothetical protein KC19_5G145500 [Ceratodon purpureus]KAG0616747.1 hypothetical protein M758_5G139300 [Ceratodon purpureus]